MMSWRLIGNISLNHIQIIQYNQSEVSLFILMRVTEDRKCCLRACAHLSKSVTSVKIGFWNVGLFLWLPKVFTLKWNYAWRVSCFLFWHSFLVYVCLLWIAYRLQINIMSVIHSCCKRFSLTYCMSILLIVWEDWSTDWLVKIQQAGRGNSLIPSK